MSREVILVPLLKFKRLNISVQKLDQVRQNIQKWIKSIPENVVTTISLLIYILDRNIYLHSGGANGSSLAFKNNMGTLMFSNGFLVKDDWS